MPKRRPEKIVVARRSSSLHEEAILSRHIVSLRIRNGDPDEPEEVLQGVVMKFLWLHIEELLLSIVEIFLSHHEEVLQGLELSQKKTTKRAKEQPPPHK